MPWHVTKSATCPAAKPWAVIKDSDGSTAGCHASEAAANSQLAALYAAEGRASAMEIRTVHHAVRAAKQDDGRPGITVRAIVPGVVDDFGTLWDAHAFDESLERKMPRLAWSHRWDEPLGPPVSWERSDEGPLITFAFSDFDAVPMAKRAHAQVLDGTIEDVSVGFSYMAGGVREPSDEERSKYPGVTEVVSRAMLPEVSLVLEGAVPGAQVMAVRSAKLRSGALVDLEAVFEIAQAKASGRLTDAEANAAVALLAHASAGDNGDTDEHDDADEGPTDEELAAEAAKQAALDAAMLDAEAIATEALSE